MDLMEAMLERKEVELRGVVLVEDILILVGVMWFGWEG
jgi:hypothetical protein